MDVSVRELKSGLSSYLRRVQAGETLVVTSRGKPVANVVPVSRSLALERLADLPGIDAGSGGKPQGARPPVGTEPGQKSTSDIVLESRR